MVPNYTVPGPSVQQRGQQSTPNWSGYGSSWTHVRPRLARLCRGWSRHLGRVFPAKLCLATASFVRGCLAQEASDLWIVEVDLCT
jgi:hypothetical protein